MSRISQFRELNLYKAALGTVLDVHARTKIAMRIGLIDEEQFKELDLKYGNIIGMIVRILDAPEKWVIDSKKGVDQ